MAKMSQLSSAALHEQQEIALEHIREAHERDDTIDEAYFRAKLISADTCDAALGEGFEGKPLMNDDGFCF